MPRGLCFYSRCKNAELEQFYKERTGEDMPKTKKRMTKKDLANELRKVDRRPWKHGKKFRFLDLPPEMRNIIYRELLPVLPPGTRREPNESRCQPAILRTCKQIYTEAKSILYGDHEGEILVSSLTTLPFPGRRGQDLRVFRKTLVFRGQQRVTEFDDATLVGNRDSWPSFLLNFTRVNVKVEMEVGGAPRPGQVPFAALAATCQELLGVTSFFSRSTALKVIGVTLPRPETLDEDSKLLSMLQPLARIGSNVNLDMTNVPQEIEEQILGQKEAHTNGNHFFADFQETHATLKELESFRGSVEPKGTLGTIRDQVAVMDAVLDVPGFVDEKVELQLREATAAAKAFLAGGIVDKVNRLARRKAKEIKQEAAKKVDELEAQRQKFIGVGKAAKGASGIEKEAKDSSTTATN